MAIPQGKRKGQSPQSLIVMLPMNPAQLLMQVTRLCDMIEADGGNRHDFLVDVDIEPVAQGGKAVRLTANPKPVP